MLTVLLPDIIFECYTHCRESSITVPLTTTKTKSLAHEPGARSRRPPGRPSDGRSDGDVIHSGRGRPSAKWDWGGFLY